MSDPALLTFAAAATLSVGIVCATLLRAWRGWLQVRQAGLGSEAVTGAAGAADPELGNLKQRVRKLEAIASGVDY